MCGIVGYIGPNQVEPVIVDGVKRPEHRGYDSAGVAVVNQHGTIETRGCSGKLRNLAKSVTVE